MPSHVHGPEVAGRYSNAKVSATQPPGHLGEKATQHSGQLPIQVEPPEHRRSNTNESDHSSSEQSSAGYWEDQYSTSQNRFPGPAHVYKSYIAEERGLLAALQQDDADDLSRHLHAAHVLSNGNLEYSGQRIGNFKAWQLKSTRQQSEQDESLLSDRWWTAWPLTPSKVPRLQASQGRARPSNEHLYRSQTLDISTEIQDLLIGLTTRLAREQWSGRFIDDKVEARVSSGRQTGASKLTSDSVESLDQDGVLPGMEMLASTSDRHTSPELAASASHTDSCDVPILSADQDHPTRLAEPIIRHVLKQFDQVLRALHTSRYHQYGRNKGARVDSSFGIAHAGGSSQDDSGLSELEPSRRSSAPGVATTYDNSHRILLPPRDWSEVLGCAALVGVDSAVIHRVATRCAELFGEGISLGVVNDGSLLQPLLRNVDYLPSSTPTYEELIRNDIEDDGKTWDIDTLLCPHVDCRYSKEKLSERRRVINHVRSVHKWDPLSQEPPVEKLGGVHIDGFLQTIQRRAGWNDNGQPQSSGGEDERSGEEHSSGRSKRKMHTGSTSDKRTRTKVRRQLRQPADSDSE